MVKSVLGESTNNTFLPTLPSLYGSISTRPETRHGSVLRASPWLKALQTFMQSEQCRATNQENTTVGL